MTSPIKHGRQTTHKPMGGESCFGLAGRVNPGPGVEQADAEIEIATPGHAELVEIHRSAFDDRGALAVQKRDFQ